MRPGGPGDGKLHVGDRILAVAGQPAEAMSHEFLIDHAARSLSLELVIMRTAKQLTRTESGRFNVHSGSGATSTSRLLVRNAPSLGRGTAAPKNVIVEEDGPEPERVPATRSPAPLAEDVESETEADEDVQEITVTRGLSGFGFTIMGPDPEHPHVTGVFVTNIVAEPAKGSGLQIGHQLVALRSSDGLTNLRNLSHYEATQALRSVDGTATLLVVDNRAGFKALTANGSSKMKRRSTMDKLRNFFRRKPSKKES